MKEELKITTVSDEVQRQMPNHIKPGSVLAEIRCPLSLLWSVVEAVGLEDNQTLYTLFQDHLNNSHIRK